MEQRFNMQQLQPQAFKAVLGLEGYLATTDLSKTLKELIKIRASQINNCAYCIDMHTRDAISNGEDVHRLLLVSAWREAKSFFSEEEQTAMAMAEEITLIHQQGLSADTYARATAVFSETQIAQIIMAVVTINAWNRIAVSTHQQIGK
ncbi:MAG: carboxymuconolactone decarboxylase family protein [Chitinophagaceae bacterium]